jgi:predicted nuclease of predicted toxin-antitoxin system
VKLLFDENLSRRLGGVLADIYPESIHVEDVGLLGARDLEIWNFAAEHGFLVVSKDTDFYERSVLYGAPPKLIWLRIGNASVRDTAALLRDNYIIVRHFYDESESPFLVLPTRSSKWRSR